MKKKLAIPILIVLSLSILSQISIPSPAGYDSPAIFIEAVDYTEPDLTKTPGQQITINVRTDYDEADIWGYDFALAYNPVILNGYSVTNGPVISTTTVVFTAGTFNDTIGKLDLTEAFSEDQTAPQPYPRLENTGPGVLATVVFDVVGSGETNITLVAMDTKLKRINGTNIVDGYLDSTHLGHGYFRNVASVPNHDVAATGVVFHHDRIVTTTFNETTNMTYIDANVENNGDMPEIFNVKISYIVGSYPTLVKEETIVVSNGGSDTVTGGLNTTAWLMGYLTIQIEISTVPGEVATSDNTYTAMLLIKMTGDVQGDPTDPNPLLGDGDVDRYDAGAMSIAYGYVDPHAKYNQECDFNRNGKADRYDAGILSVRYGRSIGNYTCPL